MATGPPPAPPDSPPPAGSSPASPEPTVAPADPSPDGPPADRSGVLDFTQPFAQTDAQFTRIVDERPNVESSKVERQADVAAAKVLVQAKSYAPRDRAQDNTRQIITLWLIGLFCAIVVLSFVALLADGVRNGFRDGFYQALKALLDVLLGPVITLLSTAIGFYFGYQQGTGQSPATKPPADGPGAS